MEPYPHNMVMWITKAAAILTAAVFLGPCVGSGAAHANTYENCSTNYSVLEAAYLNTEENHFKTWATFYPPRDPLPLFVKVTYEFQDKNGETQNYNNTLTAHYFWTTESIFLMQPPQVFGFTSLFLGYTGRERIQQVILVLPYECSGLTITIEDDKYNRLEVLTQRLKLYAQRSNGVTLTDNYFAKAIDESSDGLVDKYRNNKILNTFVSVLIGLPFLFLMLILLYAKSARWQIRKRLVLETPAAHASLAAVVVTGLLFAIFVVFVDAAALYYAINDNEFENTKSEKHSFNNVPLLCITAVTFVLDLIFTVGALITLIVASCHRCLWEKHQDPCNNMFRFFCCFIFCCSTVPKDSVEEKSIWLLSGVVAAPIVCIGTHFGYILIAWLSNPLHAGSIFMAYIVFFVYYFFTFRQLYLLIVDPVTYNSYLLYKRLNAQKSSDNEKNPLTPQDIPDDNAQWIRYLFCCPCHWIYYCLRCKNKKVTQNIAQRICYLFCCPCRWIYYLFCCPCRWIYYCLCCKNEKVTQETPDIELGQPLEDEEKSKKLVKGKFQFIALWIELVYGVFFLVPLHVWVTAGLVTLPINDLVENASNYLFAISTTVFVPIAGLATYKLLVIHPKDPNNNGSQ